MVEKSITVRAGYGLGAIPGFTWQSLTTFRRRNPFKLRSAKILLGGSNGLQDRRHWPLGHSSAHAGTQLGGATRTNSSSCTRSGRRM